MVNLRQSAARAAAIASDFGTNSAGWENSTGSASLGEMITRVPMRTLSNGFLSFSTTMKTPARVSRPAVPLDTGNNIGTQEPRHLGRRVCLLGSCGGSSNTTFKCTATPSCRG